MSKRCDSNKNMRAAFQMLNSHSRNSGRILLGDYLDYISLKFLINYVAQYKILATIIWDLLSFDKMIRTSLPINRFGTKRIVSLRSLDV